MADSFLDRVMNDSTKYKRFVHSTMVVEFNWDRMVPASINIDAIKEQCFTEKESPYDCASIIMDRIDEAKYIKK